MLKSDKSFFDFQITSHITHDDTPGEEIREDLEWVTLLSEWDEWKMMMWLNVMKMYEGTKKTFPFFSPATFEFIEIDLLDCWLENYIMRKIAHDRVERVMEKEAKFIWKGEGEGRANLFHTIFPSPILLSLSFIESRKVFYNNFFLHHSLRTREEKIWAITYSKDSENLNSWICVHLWWIDYHHFFICFYEFIFLIRFLNFNCKEHDDGNDNILCVCSHWEAVKGEKVKKLIG